MNVILQFRQVRSLARLIPAALLLLPLWVQADFQGSHHITAYNEPPFNYADAQPDDPVARLEKRIEKGEVQLQFDKEFGYLPAVLRALKIPESSQMLVFSKTSLHRDLISPEHPRAIFFNDDVYVGWVRWAPLLEISAADPKHGAMFYVLAQNPTERPRLVRNQSCLECHVSGKSMGVPGHLVRSFDTDGAGLPDEKTGGVNVSHDTPFAERWGGWYVTGTHGKQVHRGNVFGAEALARAVAEPNYRGNLLDLTPFIATNQFPQPGSDIVALLVFEHQVHMHNFIARLNYEATVQLAQYGHVRYLDSASEAFLQYLLFAEEPPLLSRVKGTSGFAEWFTNQGPKDRRGRSLRDLDLYTRLFAYPCSYLIYSEAFDGLPGPLKDHLYRRLWEILSGQDTSKAFARISARDRKAILEILLDTKKDLPDYWRGRPEAVGGG